MASVDPWTARVVNVSCRACTSDLHVALPNPHDSPNHLGNLLTHAPASNQRRRAPGRFRTRLPAVAGAREVQGIVGRHPVTADHGATIKRFGQCRARTDF
jgi:hypothetical protein